MDWTAVLEWLVAVLVALLGGYASGRRIGHTQGRRKGVAEAPIELRRTALDHGTCPICRTSVHAVVQWTQRGE